MKNELLWLSCLLWGLFSGSSLILGSLLGYYLPISKKTNALIMAFGAGTLFSAIGLELIPKAFSNGGPWMTSGGFLGGGALFTMGNLLLIKRGAHHRKRSGKLQKSEKEKAGSGLALAMGALMDGIPESLVLGLSIVAGGTVSVVTLVAIFISNLPEGLSSSMGMKNSGRSKKYIFGLWSGLTLVSGLGSLAAYFLYEIITPGTVSLITAAAAGAILTMLIDTMIPEAYEEGNTYIGIIALFGFVLAFLLSHTHG